MDPALRAFEEHRREFIETMRELRRKNPHMEPEELQKQAEYEMISKGPKSRAFYRVQATRRLVGGGDIVRKRLAREHDKALDIVIEAQERQARHNTCRIFFDPAHYTVLENVGTFGGLRIYLCFFNFVKYLYGFPETFYCFSKKQFTF
ncbi:unnamed protein product [Meloidogyne enterolobii]|uniref:Uncharacterized protein n=1 Tax=Meloidogyne enterolobii TaxID=390850 RepID=A0ACB0Y116_MELEN